MSVLTKKRPTKTKTSPILNIEISVDDNTLFSDDVEITFIGPANYLDQLKRLENLLHFEDASETIDADDML